MKKLLLVLIILPMFVFSQRPSIGFYFGPVIGYNLIYDQQSLNNYEGTQNLLNFNYNDNISLLENLSLASDGDLSNFELFSGEVFGFKMNMLVMKGVSIQAELEYEQLEFNHIICQNGSSIFNSPYDLTGLDNNSQFKISNYFWRVNYFNFPFVLKFYPSKNSFFQFGAKFGYLVKAKQSTLFSIFDNNNSYIDYFRPFNDEVTYDLFDADSGVTNHGFNPNEWPFEWNVSIISGLGYETKNIYFSLRYNFGILDFFRELKNKENDFFENYNSEYSQIFYQDFQINPQLLNNNFRLHSIHLTFGYHFSYSKQ